MRTAPRHIQLLIRLAVASAIVFFVALVVSRVDFRRKLDGQRMTILSGAEDGNHFLVVGRLGKLAALQHGNVHNLTSNGSVENAKRLADGAHDCSVQFALVQDGVPLPAVTPELALIARLPRAESVLLVGPKASGIRELSDLKHLRIGIGPDGSGTSVIAREIFDSTDFRELGAVLSQHPFSEQLELASKGELDLAFFVIDESAPIIEKAVRERGFQVAGVPHAAAIAHRMPHLLSGVITAGLYDPIRVLPPRDEPVLHVETLVLGNACATRSQTVALLGLLSHEFPDFVRYNRETPNPTDLTLSRAAQGYFDHQGPELADQYAPWLVDFMPPANWAWVIAGVSVLFNMMGFGNRFQLYRIDALRVKIDHDITQLFGSNTIQEIGRLSPDERTGSAAAQEALRRTILALEDLLARSRRYSVSWVVPMGQEMAYRYQESLIQETLTLLREFAERSASRAV